MIGGLLVEEMTSFGCSSARGTSCTVEPFLVTVFAANFLASMLRSWRRPTGMRRSSWSRDERRSEKRVYCVA